MKPSEFWSLQPKDIFLMTDGYNMKREYEESLHLETLRLLRFNAYCTYIAIPTKKGAKKSKITKLYPLPKDTLGNEITKEVIDAVFNDKVIYITNGKNRGYMDRNGNLFAKDDKDRLIGKIENNKIKYIN